MSEPRRLVVDGNEAAAAIAHRLSEVIAIYPITPSSPMGEFADSWSAHGRTNLWGAVPLIRQRYAVYQQLAGITVPRFETPEKASSAAAAEPR